MTGAGYAAIAKVRKAQSTRYDPWTFNTEYHVAGQSSKQVWGDILFEREIAALTKIVRSDASWAKPKCPQCTFRDIAVKGLCKRCYDVRFIRHQREQERAQRLD